MENLDIIDKILFIFMVSIPYSQEFSRIFSNCFQSSHSHLIH